MWFLLAAFTLSATTMLSHYLIGRSLPLAYGAVAGRTSLILYFIFGTISFTGAILMSFYFFPAVGVRFMGNFRHFSCFK
jgi:hypothetical protein